MKTISNKLVIVLACILVWLLIDRCSLSKKYDESQSTISALSLENQRLDSIKNVDDAIILTQKTIITDVKGALDKLTDTIFNLKKRDERNSRTIAYYKSITSTNIDSVGIPYLDTIAMKKFADSVEEQCMEVLKYVRANMITVPRRIEKYTPDYRFVGEVLMDEVRIHSLVIPDTLQLRFVEKKRGFLKKKGIEVQFFHSNPLITTTQANSVIYVPKKKSLLKEIGIPLAIGVGVGLLIEK